MYEVSVTVDILYLFYSFIGSRLNAETNWCNIQQRS